jgi:hypothetical protein
VTKRKPWNTKTLWDAVKKQMIKYQNDSQDCVLKIVLKWILDETAKYVNSKVKSIIDTVAINEKVYNGHSLVNGQNKMFMDT